MMQVLISSLLALVLFICGLAVYRLLLSPIAGFPGPKIAALTSWYEFYHDYWCLGSYVFQIEKMHQDHGRWCTIRLGEVKELTLPKAQSCALIPMSYQYTTLPSTARSTLQGVKDVPRITATLLKASILTVRELLENALKLSKQVRFSLPNHLP